MFRKSQIALRYIVNPFSSGASPREIEKAVAKIAPGSRVLLDIGCFNGKFLCSLAPHLADEGVDYLFGVDLQYQRFPFSGFGAEGTPLERVSLFKGNAWDFVPMFTEAAKRKDIILKRITVLYPDPWPKPKHAKRRLINADFLRSLAEAGRGSPVELLLETDSEALLNYARAQFRASAHWETWEDGMEHFKRWASIIGPKTSWQTLSASMPSHQLSFISKPQSSP